MTSFPLAPSWTAVDFQRLDWGSLIYIWGPSMAWLYVKYVKYVKNTLRKLLGRILI